MNKNAIIAQMEAIRAQLDATLFLLAEPDPDPAPCQHPPESRIDMATMGTTRWQCRICGYQHEEVT